MSPEIRRRAAFATTRWSLVLEAAGAGREGSRDALGALCQAYWYPLYAFLRRQGHPAEEAEDLVQGFFARLVEKDVIGRADRERGRFRTFLLTALKNFAANEHDRQRAQKRGGDRQILDLDATGAEGQYALEPRTVETPEHLFERRWALTVIERALAELRRQSFATGRGSLFESLQGMLTGEDADVPYRDLAGKLSLSEGALRVAVHRMRKALKRQLEREIVQTLADPDDLVSEVQFLKAAVARLGSDDRR